MVDWMNGWPGVGSSNWPNGGRKRRTKAASRSSPKRRKKTARRSPNSPSQRTSPKLKPARLKKGSAAAKAYMAKIRKLRK